MRGCSVNCEHGPASYRASISLLPSARSAVSGSTLDLETVLPPSSRGPAALGGSYSVSIESTEEFISGWRQETPGGGRFRTSGAAGPGKFRVRVTDNAYHTDRAGARFTVPGAHSRENLGTSAILGSRWSAKIGLSVSRRDARPAWRVHLPSNIELLKTFATKR